MKASIAAAPPPLPWRPRTQRIPARGDTRQHEALLPILIPKTYRPTRTFSPPQRVPFLRPL